MNTKGLFIFLAILFCSCRNNVKHECNVVTVDSAKVLKQNPQLMVMGEYNFGSIYKSKTPYKKISIEICNMGEKPLALAKVDVSCGCMKVDFVKVPIPSKQKGCINVIIDTKNQKGVFDKPIFIKSNAINDLEIVRIKGEIK